jgi:hypothetical protein
MKSSAYLINVARGGIVDETALYNALKEGTIAGAALDVFAEEPTTNSPLFSLPNVVVTPHLGASTVEAQDRERTWDARAEQIVEVRGMRPGGGDVTVSLPRGPTFKAGLFGAVSERYVDCVALQDLKRVPVQVLACVDARSSARASPHRIHPILGESHDGEH